MPLNHRSVWPNWLLSLTLLLALIACSSPPPKPPSDPFEQDVIEATEGLAGQWRGLTPLRWPWSQSTLALGPFVDLSATTTAPAPAFARQQTVAAVRARELVARHIDAGHTGFRRVPATLDDAAPAELLLSASLVPAVLPGMPAQDTRATPLVLTLVLLDLRTRQIVARWQNPLRTQARDADPSVFESASPVLMNQTATQARATLFNAPTRTELSAPAVQDAIGLARLDLAQQAYADNDLPRALALFQEVAAKSPELALRAYNGQYLSHLKLGQTEAANQAFKRVVAAGFASRRLGVKLLFTPGLTAFWADPAVSGAYGFWLQEISAQAAAAATCLEIAGHTSRSGREAFNLELSQARSERVRQIMVAQQPPLASRIRASGKGWSENIIGSGSDDARDAIDRRVEFKIGDCAAP